MCVIEDVVKIVRLIVKLPRWQLWYRKHDSCASLATLLRKVSGAVDEVRPGQRCHHGEFVPILGNFRADGDFGEMKIFWGPQSFFGPFWGISAWFGEFFKFWSSWALLPTFFGKGNSLKTSLGYINLFLMVRNTFLIQIVKFFAASPQILLSLDAVLNTWFKLILTLFRLITGPVTIKC